MVLIAVDGGSTTAAQTAGTSSGIGGAGVAGLALYGLSLLVSLALFLPLLSAVVRRLHDTDRSGWWYLLGLVPFGGIVLVVFWALDGTPGSNRFGVSPEGAGSPGGPAPHGQQEGYGHPTQA